MNVAHQTRLLLQVITRDSFKKVSFRRSTIQKGPSAEPPGDAKSNRKSRRQTRQKPSQARVFARLYAGFTSG